MFSRARSASNCCPSTTNRWSTTRRRDQEDHGRRRASARTAAVLDTGTHDALLDVARFVQVLQHRQGVTIACLVEVAMRCGYITADEARALAGAMGSSSYADYLGRAAARYAADGI